MIKKEKLIELFENWKARLSDSPQEDFLKVLLKCVIDKIAAFPEEDVTDINVGSKWIPVSKQLPTTDGRFEVTIKESKGKRHVEMENFHAESKIWGCKYCPERVIAWRKRPEPYKEEE